MSQSQMLLFDKRQAIVVKWKGDNGFNGYTLKNLKEINKTGLWSIGNMMKNTDEEAIREFCKEHSLKPEQIKLVEGTFEECNNE